MAGPEARAGRVEAANILCKVTHYVGPDVYQFWNFYIHPIFSYSKNTLDKNKIKY